MNFIFKILISTLAIFLTAKLLPGVKVDSIMIAILVAVVLAFLNSVIKPVMVILTIPVTIVSFGIFLLFINAFIILIADKIVDGFEVKNFGWAFLFSIIMWVVTVIFESFDKSKRPSMNDDQSID